MFRLSGVRKFRIQVDKDGIHIFLSIWKVDQNSASENVQLQVEFINYCQKLSIKRDLFVAIRVRVAVKE